jgi:hypothetical protein
MVVLAIFLLLIPFTGQYRSSSLWVRAVTLILAINSLIWSALGFALIFYSAHLTAYARASFLHCKWLSTGIALGLLISLLFSVEFRHLAAPGVFGQRGLTKR